MHRRKDDLNVGLGLRRELLDPLQAEPPSQVQFLEVAPENWMGVGGKLGKIFRSFSEQYPIFCHGLSLSLGGPSPLDKNFLKQLKSFLNENQIIIYSEHLSYCGDKGHLYDLLPIPFTDEAVRYVAKRIRRVQEILERRIAVENVSYYLTPPSKEMDELSFLKAVLKEADCQLLLDVNNIYVNSINQRYDPYVFLKGMPSDRIAYFHIAGHYVEAPDLRIDTHGAAVIDPVWDLLDETYRLFGIHPTLLERDFHLPPLGELLKEVDHIHRIQNAWKEQRHAKGA